MMEPTLKVSEAIGKLLMRNGDPHAPSLENRVAYQGDGQPDTLGFRHAVQRDRIVLKWLAERIEQTKGEAEALDVGCAYGNHMLMLDARLGLPERVMLCGVDMDEHALEFGRAFAAVIPGYQNCHYRLADVEAGLPFPDATFDAVNLADIVEHLERPAGALAEICRVLKPGGIVVVSTPLRDGLFKRLARCANWVSAGRLHAAYYHGKGAEVDADGHASMDNRVGHAHVSEMTLRDLKRVCGEADLHVERVHLMAVMSGSAWFDRHPFLLSALLFLEALHGVFRRASWAHSACVLLRKPLSCVSSD